MDSRRQPGGAALETFTILTGYSNELVRPICNRMVVIFMKEHHAHCLDPKFEDTDALARLPVPCRLDEVNAYRVSSVRSHRAPKRRHCLAVRRGFALAIEEELRREYCVSFGSQTTHLKRMTFDGHMKQTRRNSSCVAPPSSRQFKCWRANLGSRPMYEPQPSTSW